MFLPRVLQKKRKPPSDAHPELSPCPQVTRDPNPLTNPTSLTREAEPQTKRVRIHSPDTNDEYLEQLVCGIELVFTDYAYQDDGGGAWLKKYGRVIHGESSYIHLSALLIHPSLAALKPAPTQKTLRRALQSFPSPDLEITGEGYFVRRRVSTYPLSFIPTDASTIINDDGLSFWDKRTLYVEPHLSTMCNKPAVVAWWLKKYGKLRSKWLPIQAIKTIAPSCAFVVLSGCNAKLSSSWDRWAAKKLPNNWITMTKAEHDRRTKEYLSILNTEGSGSPVQSVFWRQNNRAKENNGLVPFLDEIIFADAFPTHEHTPIMARRTTDRFSRASASLHSASSDNLTNLQERHKPLIQLVNLPLDSSENEIKTFVIGISRRTSNVEKVYYNPGDTTAIIRFTSVEDAEFATRTLGERFLKSTSISSQVEARLMTSVSRIDHAGLIDRNRDDDKNPSETTLATPNAASSIAKKPRRRRKKPKRHSIDT
ncbi:hypothetical protein AOQ84DRAFT_173046 [Glonium stellatum]|uniref:RRM domain-containing protein n=1 Tax=Glonium stellatum TaxID=574774 RepID=A0A8E2JWA4_9PEZI|nr:hypothetical protein AOQ84DRAFT_173046 [Glonium stellatum]